MAGRRAPSLHLVYNYKEPGDILVTDVQVPASGLTKQTYYCCLNWNAGRNGGGYCGIQDHDDGRNFIFSIWDPEGTSAPITPIFTGPGTKCERFGGEGTGLKSWNFELGWEPDNWLTFVVRRWDNDGNTHFALWVKDHLLKQWHHIITMNFPVAGISFNGSVCSFLEDWMGTGENVRRVLFRHGFKRLLNGAWKGFGKAMFTMVKEDSSKVFEDNYDAGICDDAFFLQSGGHTVHSSNLVYGNIIERITSEEPEVAATDFRVTWKGEGEFEWDIEVGEPPQFLFIVKVDGEEVETAVDSERRKYKLENYRTGQVNLIIENIFGRRLVKNVFSPE